MNSFQKIIKYLAIALAIFLSFSITIGIYQSVGKVVGLLVKNDNIKEEINNVDKTIKNSSFIYVSNSYSNLTIKEGNKLKVECSDKYITINEFKNKLIIKERKNKLFNNSYKSNIVIYVPKNLILDKLYIEGGAGKIDISNISVKDLELEIGAGKLSINNLKTLSNTKIEGGLGKIDIKDSNLNNIKLDMGAGSTTINSVLTGKSEINAGIGEAIINLQGNEEYYNINTKAGIGTVTINGFQVKDTSYGTGSNIINISGGIGSVKINLVK